MRRTGWGLVEMLRGGGGYWSSPGFKLRVVVDGRQCAFRGVPRRRHGLGVARSRGAHGSRRGAARHLRQTADREIPLCLFCVFMTFIFIKA